MFFSGSPARRRELLDFSLLIANNNAFLTAATIIPKGGEAENRIQTTQKSIKDFMAKKNISCLVRVFAAKSMNTGIINMIRAYGMGDLYPNTVILGASHNEEQYYEFAELIIKIFQAERNLILINLPQTDFDELILKDKSKKNKNPGYFKGGRGKSIDIWWAGEKRNAGLSLAMCYLIQKNPLWARAQLNLKSIVRDPEDLETAEKKLQNKLDEAHIKAKSKVYLHENKDHNIFLKISEKSKNTSLSFLGMKAPNLLAYQKNKEKAVTEYSQYYKNLMNNCQKLPPSALILAAEDISFHKIFNKENSLKPQKIHL